MAIFSNCLTVLGRAIAVLVLMNDGARSSKAQGKPTRADRRLGHLG